MGKSKSSSQKKFQLDKMKEDSKSITTAVPIKRKRGISTMERVTKRKIQGVKPEIMYNKVGQPFGEAAQEMQSYIGVKVRTCVPINIQRWSNVNKGLKDRIWEYVQMAYRIRPESKKLVLSSAAVRFRNFKNKLTTEYILPFADQPEMLQSPPGDYNFIEKTCWKDFVASRLTGDFMKLHKAQQERRAKNEYNHRMSRGGYVGLQEKLSKTIPLEKLDRATLWVKGRENKDGNITDEKVAEKATLIEEYRSQVADGTLTQSGSDDVLTKALGTAEHAGRVRGVGGYVSPSSYFNLPKSKRVLSKEIKECFRQIVMKECENSRKLVAEEREFWLNQIHQFIPAFPPSKLKAAGLPAKLTEEVLRHPTTPTPSTAAQISDKASCSAVKGERNDHVLEKNPVYDAVDGKNDHEDNALTEKLDESDGGPEMPKVVYEDLPKILKIVCKYAETILKPTQGVIAYKIDKEVFGFERESFIFHENILEVGAKAEVGSNTIVLYMRYLYEVAKVKNMTSMIGLVDPSQISENTGDYNRKSQILADRFTTAEPNQIFLVPNNFGYHWMLTIVDPGKEIIYQMDPLFKIIKDSYGWRDVVNTALKISNAQKQHKKGRKVPSWKILRGTPKQKNSIDCGYFVMRFMKEIIEDGNLDFVRKWEKRNDNIYTAEEIDEVRAEWADFLFNKYV